MSDSSCIFCRIAAGEIPARVVHQTESAMVFLDVAPLAAGHLLVIPKSHFAEIDQMPPDEVSAIASIIPRLVAALKGLDGVDGVNVLQNNGRTAGQAVDHVHFHLIPRKGGDGLGYRWNAGAYGEGEADRYLELVRSLLADAS